MTTIDSKIIIVGAGVFGLSTALHLKRRGYKDITVFDYQPYDQNAYNPNKGCDAASADVNKILRWAYGKETEYQNLAQEARSAWLEWNNSITSTPAGQLPAGLVGDRPLFVPCGLLRMATGQRLDEYDQDSITQLEKAGLRESQHILKDRSDMVRLKDKERATGQKWRTRIGALATLVDRGHDGYVDTSAGFVYADKACAWARYLCEKEGVRFVLGKRAGKLDHLIVDYKSNEKRVRGIVTADGQRHYADVVVVACGGWTPSLMPEVDGRLETTAGSVITFTLPSNRQDLWDKFAPENFPVWAYGLTGHTSPEWGGFYGFPRTPEGVIKMGYRGRKWTNYQTSEMTKMRVSTPTTKFSDVKATNLPKKTINMLKKVVGELFPELMDIGITDTRMCWYTDSLDNNFLIDYVPGYNRSLFVCSGGSGHGFKFLPVLGEHVVNALEQIPDQFTPLWKWRTAEPGQRANGLEEGESSGRNLADLEMAVEQDWAWVRKNNPDAERVLAKL